ncbi:hypothetical protein WDW86_21845 [Bdellovibrionota bacterium FG-2]
MAMSPLYSPSVGSIIKKLIAINPELSMQELAAIIRHSTAIQGGADNEFSTIQVIDEAKALGLAPTWNSESAPTL